MTSLVLKLLSQEADTTVEWQRSDIAKLFSIKPGFDVAPTAGNTGAYRITPETADALERSVAELVNSLDTKELIELAKLKPQDGIPYAYDSMLLNGASNNLGLINLERAEVTHLRRRFREMVRENAEVQ